MAEICNTITKNITSADCPRPGGLNRRSWVFLLSMLTGAFTYNGTTGALSGFSIVAGQKGIKGMGRPKKGSGASTGTQAENGSFQVEQTLIQQFGFKNQLELNALTDFLKAGGKVVFQELNSGAIRVYFKEFGNETGTGEEGSGETLNADNGIMTTTLKGFEPEFPTFFEAPITAGETQLAASRAYLDALCVA
ncbi:hypothetical protein [Solirubrum puertoriconensis]|uniref:Uncharacterized protein n=1 Tax=Solirubrum puertoriconensis TaxID=1751427 RepID=A0A9X0HJ96_SOLP1|nr:hypothetical protein [Solirubrum puertoriconensis]KUG06881.1 hypothetical protein ASU33_06030 [Solirubrum puertoriconensis]